MKDIRYYINNNKVKKHIDNLKRNARRKRRGKTNRKKRHWRSDGE